MSRDAGGWTSVRAQLESIHASLREQLPGIGRVAVAVYDDRTDMLQTFVHSTDGETPFNLYEARLSSVPGLAELARTHRDRIVDDLSADHRPPTPHTRRLLETGYRSSFTKPFYDHGALFGFLFFDARQPAYFTAPVVRHLSLYSHLISLLIINALARASVLRSAVDIAREISHLRDAETGAHLDRMSRYARMIANSVAVREGRDDEYVEFVFLFAPLHDVGKIAIPDRVLLKPGKLTAGEFELMKTHVEKGVALIDKMADRFGVGAAEHIDILRNIVQFHHESYDGSGYLAGLAGDAIPLEARIVSVADVFDALTSRRPYKEPWSNDDAFRLLADLAGSKFDPGCVAALTSLRPTVERIQDRFRHNGSPFDGFHEAYLEDL
ncbi:MAG: HD domain-containing phosphohydrolase [Rhodospirillales bacterium]